MKGGRDGARQGGGSGGMWRGQGVAVAHWHVWRVATYAVTDEPGTVDVKGRFFLDAFPDTESAGAGLAVSSAGSS